MITDSISKITTILSSFVLTLLPSDLQERLSVERKFREIENITNPQQVIWRDDNRILFVLEEKLLEYSVEEETLTEVGQRGPNEFLGIGKNGEIIFCGIEHYIISSPDEFSTKLTVKFPNKKDNELYFFETIRPLDINEERIIAVTALDFLEKNFYKIDIENGDKKQVPPLRKVKRKVLVPKDIQFKKAYVRNRERYVVEDIFGNVYLFTQKVIQ
jgi:hypothetical protein